jgi:hypothetical protein
MAVIDVERLGDTHVRLAVDEDVSTARGRIVASLESMQRISQYAVDEDVVVAVTGPGFRTLGFEVVFEFAHSTAGDTTISITTTLQTEQSGRYVHTGPMPADLHDELLQRVRTALDDPGVDLPSTRRKELPTRTALYHPEDELLSRTHKMHAITAICSIGLAVLLVFLDHTIVNDGVGLLVIGVLALGTMVASEQLLRRRYGDPPV